ncbi:MAG: hypothetical protein LBP21_03345 [Synergistaceae bacterium]|jgi:hypothetical protein|nr:hypothetical protein [Synergistaceae bacterium]
MRTERILDSANCSEARRLGEKFIAKEFQRVVAAVCLATALFFDVCSAAAMVVQGVPQWLEPHVLRGLSAVWDEVPAGEEPVRLETLSVVARQLFPGYRVTVQKKDGAPYVLFEAHNPVKWKTSLVAPELRSPISSWFGRDVSNLGGEIAPLLENLPLDALPWVDSALKDRIGELIGRRLPGWDFALLVRVAEDTPVLQISFRGRQPLVLAVAPSIFSSTLPVMFQSDLRAKLLSGLSPIIGLPVEWIASHRADVELLAQDFLEDRNAVSNTRSKVEVAFVPGQVSKVDSTVDSERFIVQIWLAGYAGIEGRYPEMGILLGWNTKQWTGIGLEFYNETIMDVGDFGLSNRLGLRFPLWSKFRVGVELEWPEQEVWYRAWWDSERVRRFYSWWRYSVEYGHNAAIGYRINEHVSVEVHYDGRYNEKVGLRGILLL